VEKYIPGGADIGRAISHLYDDDGRNSIKTRSGGVHEAPQSSQE
jgi:hypothetical protein